MRTAGVVQPWGFLLRLIAGGWTGLPIGGLLVIIRTLVIALVRRRIAIARLLGPILIVTLLGLGRLLGSPIHFSANGTCRASQ